MLECLSDPCSTDYRISKRSSHTLARIMQHIVPPTDTAQRSIPQPPARSVPHSMQLHHSLIHLPWHAMFCLYRRALQLC